MSQYHKIQTVYLRDPENRYKTLLDGQFALVEFAYLSDCDWVWTEKVDGTNIRVIVPSESEREVEGCPNLTFGGKTDNAQIPAFLVNRLRELFDHQAAELMIAFPAGAVLYGEGFGAKIQKGGRNYKRDGQDFVLFDVRTAGWWLKREAVESVSDKFHLPVVPVIGRGPLSHMVMRARNGFDSRWGPFAAEGIVARPAVELVARNGKRIITKIKHKDFGGKP